MKPVVFSLILLYRVNDNIEELKQLITEEAKKIQK